MADEQPAAPAVIPAVTPVVTPVVTPGSKKKCPGCGHEVGTPHDENCIYGGTVEDAIAV